MSNGKIVTAKTAVSKIKSGATVATGGFVGIGFAEYVVSELEKRFLEEHQPTGLTLIYAAGQGDGKDRGLNHLGYENLIKRVIGGHWGLAPKLQQLAVDNKIEGYNFPQGVITHMFRDIASHRPRTISRVGLHTFVDPRNGGGKVNAQTTEELIELIEFDDKQYLAYKTFPIDVAIIRGTTADTHGNITMEKEALTVESLAIAMAAKNSGGIVIIQVERIAEPGSLNSRDVKIPSILVDFIVRSKPEQHWQTFSEQYNPAYSGEIKVPMDVIPKLELNARKTIARRAAMELNRGDVINLGIGMPEGVANIAAEEDILRHITLTAEPGVIGGVPAGGLSFGAATNIEALIDQPYQFDFYDGGGLDIAFLGLAQADQFGNLNVSKFGSKLTGAGGFINISQNAKKVVFLGTLTASGSIFVIERSILRILQEGRIKKFVDQVEHVTFSGRFALETNCPTLYITERCVFSLTVDGLELIEIAPGIDLEKDILPQMGFTPIISPDLKLMDERIFNDNLMHLEI
jgi:propionate CoA-transferase